MKKKITFFLVFLSFMFTACVATAGFEAGPSVALQYIGPGVDAVYKVPLTPFAVGAGAGIGYMSMAAEAYGRYYPLPLPIFKPYFSVGYITMNPWLANAIATGIVQSFGSEEKVNTIFNGPTAKIGFDIKLSKLALNLEGGAAYFSEMKGDSFSDHLFPLGMVSLKYRF